MCSSKLISRGCQARVISGDVTVALATGQSLTLLLQNHLDIMRPVPADKDALSRGASGGERRAVIEVSLGDHTSRCNLRAARVHSEFKERVRHFYGNDGIV